MTTLLTLAEWLCGEETRRLVFEPMLADRARDLESRPSFLHRARWSAAFVLTLLQSLPASAFRRLTVSAWKDLTGRALAFYGLAFALQWFLGARLGPESGAVAWPPSFATTFLFMMMPVIWRIRSIGLPLQQQRLLTCAFAGLCVAGAWWSSTPGLALGAAQFAAAAWLTLSSWRWIDKRSEGVFTEWFTYVYPAVTLIIASVPIKVALGISLWRPWWPGDSLIAYLVGAVIALTWDVPVGDAGYRRMFNNPISIFRRED
jgi:hypothetical protein